MKLYFLLWCYDSKTLTINFRFTRLINFHQCALSPQKSSALKGREGRSKAQGKLHTHIINKSLLLGWNYLCDQSSANW